MSTKFVLIDSGHNKLTAGKRSPDSTLYEYEFNYDVSNRIAKHLQRHGVLAHVQQIEIKSSTAEVNQRVKAANDLTPDILVSIHANAYGTSFNSANGWEIFCYRLQGDSLELAQAIEKESIPYLGLRNRGIKNGENLAMVGKTSMPAVLIEHGFYTNKAECELLKTDAFREKCAIADSKGILSYLGIAWIDGVKQNQSNKYAAAVQSRFGFDDNTMKYLKEYKYAEALLKRLAETK